MTGSSSVCSMTCICGLTFEDMEQRPLEINLSHRSTCTFAVLLSTSEWSSSSSSSGRISLHDLLGGKRIQQLHCCVSALLAGLYEPMMTASLWRSRPWDSGQIELSHLSISILLDDDVDPAAGVTDVTSIGDVLSLSNCCNTSMVTYWQPALMAWRKACKAVVACAIKWNKCCNKINVLFYFIAAFILLQLFAHVQEITLQQCSSYQFTYFICLSHTTHTTTTSHDSLMLNFSGCLEWTVLCLGCNSAKWILGVFGIAQKKIENFIPKFMLFGVRGFGIFILLQKN